MTTWEQDLGLNRRPLIILTEPRSRPRMIVSEEEPRGELRMGLTMGF
jgi:hypothetical protein